MITNGRTLGKVFFGLHFCPGTAEYRDAGKEPYKVYLNGDTILKMNPTFQGKPLYVRHTEDADVSKKEPDGWVIRSFFNSTDGKTWVEFMATSEEAIHAIRNGWKLSNAYIVKDFGSGGVWNGMNYEKEVKVADYEHLAIVPNPRYAESIVLDAEGFKSYNEQKEVDLKRFANDDGKKETTLKEKSMKSIFNYFKKSTIENEADFENVVATLPKSKKEGTIASLLNEMDEMLSIGLANPDHFAMVGEERMAVKDLVSGYCNMKKNMEEASSEKKVEKEEAKDDAKAEGEAKEEAKEDKKSNEETPPAPAAVVVEEPKAPANTFMNSIKNAAAESMKNSGTTVVGGVELGKQRYGSKK